MPLQDQGMDPASLYIDLLKLSVSEALRPAQSALVVAPSERPIRRRSGHVMAALRRPALTVPQGLRTGPPDRHSSIFRNGRPLQERCAVFGRDDDRPEAP